jgi:hypothetical protein
MKGMSVLVSIVLLSAAAAQQSNKPVANGTISGTVIDQDGQPAKNFALTVAPLDVPLAAMLPATKTDQNGNFRFSGLPWWGRYAVYAVDENAGYSLFSTGSNDPKSTQEVTLSPEHPEAEFHLVLPPKAGFLEIHLTNRKTGAPIEPVLVKVMFADDPKKPIFSTSCSSTHAILVAPDKDLLLHVTSWGFREWAKSAGTGIPIRIRSGSHLTLHVELDPKS